ncbi:PP2C family protein-serine/threonine phosphatase [Mycetocola reblochoni]|nr:protein phosphatase 2C domain-containing protein [Mycetocola reblochoni]RLP70376.1 serine/threonine-protein phosphatase [Mycetocola reblochoni]
MTQLHVETGSRRLDGEAGVVAELSWAAATDTGRRREVNQDAFLASYPLFVVADGMGGHEAGDIASAAVVRRLSEAVQNPRPVDRDAVTDALDQAVEDMELEIGQSDVGTGTTVTGILADTSPVQPAGVSWTVFNVGDSRVYRLVGEELSQMTLDHSVVQELLSIGAITPEEAEHHPHSNVITRAVGFSGESVPDYSDAVPERASRWLICSDGLTKELTDYGLRHFLLAAESPEQAVVALMGAALENGGRDNVSVVVLDEMVTSD